MGAACGSEAKTGQDKEAARRSKELDKQIRAMDAKEQAINKLLLLGAGESGKSTLFKQMLLIYGHGFSNDDRHGYVTVIQNNVLTAMKTLITQAELAGGTFSEELAASVAQIKEIPTDARVDKNVAAHLAALWNDPLIQETFGNRAKFQLSDSTDYFMNKLDVISQPDYLPDTQDVLRARVRTTGIVENDFTIDGNHFKILDVGGQRSERKKWIHCFSEVTAVIFVAAISEYDQVLFEDESVNRMDEALNLFEEICNSRFFTKTALILMLNKRDLFAEKLRHVPLTAAFPDYDGNNSYEDACEYVTEMFTARNHTPGKVIYPHVTCGTDTSAMRVVFDAVKDIIIRRSLSEGGLLA